MFSSNTNDNKIYMTVISCVCPVWIDLLWHWIVGDIPFWAQQQRGVFQSMMGNHVISLHGCVGLAQRGSFLPLHWVKPGAFTHSVFHWSSLFLPNTWVL